MDLVIVLAVLWFMVLPITAFFILGFEQMLEDDKALAGLCFQTGFTLFLLEVVFLIVSFRQFLY